MPDLIMQATDVTNTPANVPMEQPSEGELVPVPVVESPHKAKTQFQFVRNVDVSMDNNNSARLRILRDVSGDVPQLLVLFTVPSVISEPPSARRTHRLEDYTAYLQDLDPRKVFAALVEAKADNERGIARSRHGQGLDTDPVTSKIKFSPKTIEKTPPPKPVQIPVQGSAGGKRGAKQPAPQPRRGSELLARLKSDTQDTVRAVMLGEERFLAEARRLLADL